MHTKTFFSSKKDNSAIYQPTPYPHGFVFKYSKHPEVHENEIKNDSGIYLFRVIEGQMTKVNEVK